MYKFTFKNGDELELKASSTQSSHHKKHIAMKLVCILIVRRLVLYPMKVMVGVMISHLVVAHPMKHTQ